MIHWPASRSFWLWNFVLYFTAHFIRRFVKSGEKWYAENRSDRLYTDAIHSFILSLGTMNYWSITCFDYIRSSRARHLTICLVTVQSDFLIHSALDKTHFAILNSRSDSTFNYIMNVVVLYLSLLIMEDNMIRG